LKLTRENRIAPAIETVDGLFSMLTSPFVNVFPNYKPESAGKPVEITEFSSGDRTLGLRMTVTVYCSLRTV